MATKSKNTAIKPLGDRVVVRQLTEDEMGTKSPTLTIFLKPPTCIRWIWNSMQ